MPNALAISIEKCRKIDHYALRLFSGIYTLLPWPMTVYVLLFTYFTRKIERAVVVSD